MPRTRFVSLKEFLLKETIDNFFLSDVDARIKWADKVWEVLQKSYAPIGGIKGSGFESKEAMISKIPMWKVFRRGEDVLAVFMYKNKAGRKRVAAGTNGTPEGKAALKHMIMEEVKMSRSWGEISGPSLRFHNKIFGEKELKDFTIPFEKVKVLLQKDYDAGKLRPVKGSDYEFEHDLNGEWIRKVAIGNPGKELNDHR